MSDRISYELFIINLATVPGRRNSISPPAASRKTLAVILSDILLKKKYSITQGLDILFSMKKYFFVIASLFTSHFVFGQSSNLTIKEIDSIVNRIDATCISGGITDYTLKSKNKKAKKTITGGGADWYYTDTTGKLLKVVREISLDTENFDTYYFHQDTLIYLKTTNLSYNGDMKIINWNRQCYFQGEKLVLNQDNLKIPFNPKNYIETAREFFVGSPIWKK